MTQTATIWLVYQLTGSPVWLGSIAFASQVPVVLLSPAAGVWVDRMDRLTLMKVTQVCSLVQSLILAFLTLSGRITIELLCILAVIQGIINAFDTPTRQALAINLAERREHLSAVIGMNSSMFNLARLIGPSIGGFVIAWLGVGLCFLLDGISYIAVIAALVAMRMQSTKAEQPPVPESAWVSFKKGIRYVQEFEPIRFLIIFNGSLALFAFSFTVLIPVYAKEIFGGDARTLGLLMSSSAAGSVSAALFMASRTGIRGMGKITMFGTVLAGTSLMVFAWSHSLLLSMGCLLFTGLGGLLVAVTNNTLVQSLVEEDKRGRVLSLFAAAFLGGIPLGSLMTGWLAEHIGVSWATTINAAASLLLGAIYFHNYKRLREKARPVLERQGLIPIIPEPDKIIP